MLKRAITFNATLHDTFHMENERMKKEYTIKELQSILGCSRTAISKKIKSDNDNTGVKRYKERYEVRMRDGQIVILFDDAELEEEKRLSKGFNTVSRNGVNTPENEDIIEIEPENKESKEDKILNFTERYIERFTTLQETFYNELKERDNKILLLTTSENAKEQEYLRTVAENKTLKIRNTVLGVSLGVAITVLIGVITFCITSITLSHNVAEHDTVIEKSAPVEQKSDKVSAQVTPQPAPKPAPKPSVRRR